MVNTNPLFSLSFQKSMPTGAFPQKKEIVFPADSIEAVQPILNKRRKLTQKDIGKLLSSEILYKYIYY